MKISYYIYFLLVLSTQCSAPAFGQTAPAEDSLQSRRSLFALPLVFYTPETDWGFGAAGMLAFRFSESGSSGRPSQLQLGFAYTLNKQFLAYLPFQFFPWKELYKIYGELGYYKYSFEYYGIGNDSPASDREIYGVSFPRFRINALRRIAPDLFGGIRYWFDDFDIRDLDPQGQLIHDNVSGSDGGLLSGAGLVLNFDHRDNIFYPAGGWLAEVVLFYNRRAFGSDFDFSKMYLDVSHYIQLEKRHILAVNLYGEFTNGIAPFNQLALLGGTKRMRGYYEGRYRDNTMLIAQAEYRFPLFWLFKGAVFGGLGRVASSISELSAGQLKSNAGAGLRILINKKEQIHIRLDAAFGQSGNRGYYVTIGEAF